MLFFVLYHVGGERLRRMTAAGESRAAGDMRPVAWTVWWGSLGPTRRCVPLLMVAVYWAGIGILGAFRIDYLVLGAGFLALYYGGPITASFYRFLLPLILLAITYDSQRFYRDALQGEIHVQDLYEYEMRFFGFSSAGEAVLPNEWLQEHTHPLLDFVTGIVYIISIPAIVGMGAFFFFWLGKTGNRFWNPGDVRERAPAVVWALFWVSVTSIATFFIYPAAPPWYVDLYGFVPVSSDIASNPAGGSRFDALVGIDVFAKYYAQSTNAFGAIPSIHVAMPVVICFFAFKFRALRIVSVSYLLLTCFSASYLNHHYVVDLLLGAFYGFVVALAVDRYYSWRKMPP